MNLKIQKEAEMLLNHESKSELISKTYFCPFLRFLRLLENLHKNIFV
jgi:hypothetical protein